MTERQYQFIWWPTFILSLFGGYLYDLPNHRDEGIVILLCMITIMVICRWSWFVSRSYDVHIGLSTGLILVGAVGCVLVEELTEMVAISMGLSSGVIFGALIIALFIQRKP